jgi:hypothetical protein
MTKKDYVAIARCISQAQTVRALADALCEVFAADNERFDRRRFMAACGF